MGNNDFIPKKATEIFMDVHNGMMSAYYFYEEPVCSAIVEDADKIVDRIRDCIAN
jgi:hypothetical protein